jgi:adenylate cyclase
METNPADLTWHAPQRAQRTIVVVDVVESVRLIEQNEFDVIDRWRRFVNEIVTEVLPPHGGRLVKSLGDGMMLEFAEVLPAVQASLEMHRRIAACTTLAVAWSPSAAPAPPQRRSHAGLPNK